MDSPKIPENASRISQYGNDRSGNGRIDLISVIWEAAEWLSSPDLLRRVAGYDRLVEYDAVRQLPLIAYLLITRLSEPDIELRTRIVKTLGSLASASLSPTGPSENVYQTMISNLSGLRTRDVFALLQVAEYDKTAEGYVADILSLCSFAGGHLSQILSNRSAPTDIRRQAAYYIGLIGYLEALPVLERLASRLESRGENEDTSILPVLQYAVQQLTAT